MTENRVRLECSICGINMVNPCLVFVDMNSTYQALCYDCSCIIQNAIDKRQKTVDGMIDDGVAMDEIGGDL